MLFLNFYWPTKINFFNYSSFFRARSIFRVQFVAFSGVFWDRGCVARPIIYNRIIWREINGMHLSFQSQMTCVYAICIIINFPAPSDTQNKHTHTDCPHLYIHTSACTYVNVFPLYFCFIVCESVCCATCTKHLTLGSLGGGEMCMGDKEFTMLIKLTVQLPRTRCMENKHLAQLKSMI
jgi:hypothetical protein